MWEKQDSRNERAEVSEIPHMYNFGKNNPPASLPESEMPQFQ